MGIASVLSILVNVISFQKCVRISPYKNTKCHFKTPQQNNKKLIVHNSPQLIFNLDVHYTTLPIPSANQIQISTITLIKFHCYI